MRYGGDEASDAAINDNLFQDNIGYGLQIYYSFSQGDLPQMNNNEYSGNRGGYEFPTLSGYIDSDTTFTPAEASALVISELYISDGTLTLALV